jgi:hypothetical protein
VTIGSAPPRARRRPEQRRPPRRRRRRWPWALGLTVVALLLGAAGVLAWSRVALAADAVALAQVDVGPLAGTVERARAVGPGGRPIALRLEDGRLTPRRLVPAGEQVRVEVVVRRPSWLAWALGGEHRERLTVRTPVAGVADRWLTVEPGSPLRVRFDHPVSSVALGPHGRRRELPRPRRSLRLPTRAAAGSIEVAAAARPWERAGAPVTVSWFPPAPGPVLIVSPAPGAHLDPLEPIRLTLSKPVAAALGSARPKLSPAVPGRWHALDSHTLAFRPSGLGAPLGRDVRLELPREVALFGGRGLKTTRRIDWTTPSGSFERLQQLLARAGYLPLDFTPAGGPVAPTPRAELEAALDPPAGSFAWRYPNTPPELRALWRPGEPNEITRGAVMMFEDEHGLAGDALPGPRVWHALLADALAGKRRSEGYSYVYVHRELPQSLNLWHDGETILSSPGNTGVPAAPTQLGTFPVFEHIPIGTMSGTNPDGSHYRDPGIRYISYFHRGEAIHAFNRASFGTPQSLGCVELPLPAAAKVWPYTPIGTLVTVEN